MASDVTPLHRCRSCGSGGEVRSLVLEGELAATGVLCQPCVDAGVSFLEGERAVFEAILAAGVDRETANAMMVAKHQHERARRLGR